GSKPSPTATNSRPSPSPSCSSTSARDERLEKYWKLSGTQPSRRCGPRASCLRRPMLAGWKPMPFVEPPYPGTVVESTSLSGPNSPELVSQHPMKCTGCPACAPSNVRRCQFGRGGTLSLCLAPALALEKPGDESKSR